MPEAPPLLLFMFYGIVGSLTYIAADSLAAGRDWFIEGGWGA